MLIDSLLCFTGLIQYFSIARQCFFRQFGG